MDESQLQGLKAAVDLLQLGQHSQWNATLGIGAGLVLMLIAMTWIIFKLNSVSVGVSSFFKFFDDRSCKEHGAKLVSIGKTLDNHERRIENLERGDFVARG